VTATTVASVEVQSVSKRFGATLVLDDVNLEIRQGEFLSLLGPSGCGKTTLLRIVAGFEHASTGRVLIGGKDVSGLPAYARSTNMIFQQLALFPHMTVFENVAFGLKMKKTAPEAIRAKVRDALELVRLEGFHDRLPDQLSGGQRQRVAMARALVNDPSVLLLDEPLGALDLQLRLQLQIELRRLHRSLGSTFIFVTHDQVEAMTMSDRIAVLDRGRIVQLGSPEEVYESPRARFVASFVGHNNLFEGRVSHVNGESCLVEIDGGRGAIPCLPRQGIALGQPVAVALRYEKVAVAPASSPLHGTGITGVVRERTFMGSFLRFAVITDWGREVIADAPATDVARAIVEGMRVQVTWGPADAAVLVE
jgi:spermidine/putrescine ABC transporter ATP-binding subunit